MLPGQHKLQVEIEEKELDIALKQSKWDLTNGDKRDRRRGGKKRDPGNPNEIKAARASHDLDRLIVVRRAAPAYRRSVKRLSEDLPIRDVTFENDD
jgi:hypothetical protein